MCADFVACAPSARGPDPEWGSPELPDPREKSWTYLFGRRFFALLSDGSEERLPFFAGMNQVISSDTQRILPLRLRGVNQAPRLNRGLDFRSGPNLPDRPHSGRDRVRHATLLARQTPESGPLIDSPILVPSFAIVRAGKWRHLKYPSGLAGANEHS
jgi:hypothetical protein